MLWAVFSLVIRALRSSLASLPAVRVTSVSRAVSRESSRVFLVRMYLGPNQPDR